MEFISVEEFLKQPHKVQKVLQEWFIEKFETSNEFDLFNYNGEDLCYKNILDRNCNFDVEDCIPLLTEGQLRKFIEDNTEGKVEFYPDVYHGERYYTIMIRDSGCGGDDPEFEVDADDVLQAYWKVAIQIAEQL
ncbi:MAG: hypothetical protein E7F68_06335 [Clostridium butyricum]|nr:hypothetical protein [Clostridium butyricum]MDU3594702.1 hypothetical protein [Clostridium butyricum]